MKTWVCLSRYGDLMNLAPIWLRDSQAGDRPKVVVSAEYAGLFDGISYADAVIFNGPTHEIQKAVDFAKTLGGDVVCTMVNGPPDQVSGTTYKGLPCQVDLSLGFQREAWKLAGKLNRWDECWPLVFDRRDAKREEKLLRAHDLIKRGTKKPLMLLSLKGDSSPFPYADLLRELVTLKFGNDWRIIELPQAERIYDLLAIYERASLLIALDSAPLHLAWACRKLPVFALTRDRAKASEGVPPEWVNKDLFDLWRGSCWRPNHLWYCRYHDWPERAVEMLRAIEGLAIPDKNCVTVWNAYESKKVWAADDALPINAGMCVRDSQNTIQDEKRAPYLRDVLRMAMQRASSDETEINLCRPQISYPHPQAIKTPFFAYRLTRNGDGDQFSPIADLFCATKKWWKELLPEIPDFVLNNDHYWSEGLRVLFQKRGATDATGCCSFVKGEK